MFEQVMNNLRTAVKKLEEDELFEQTAVKSADVVLDDPVPSSDDVDTIMQSLMGVELTPMQSSPVAGGAYPTSLKGGLAMFITEDQREPVDPRNVKGKARQR